MGGHREQALDPICGERVFLVGPAGRCFRRWLCCLAQHERGSRHSLCQVDSERKDSAGAGKRQDTRRDTGCGTRWHRHSCQDLGSHSYYFIHNNERLSRAIFEPTRRTPVLIGTRVLGNERETRSLKRRSGSWIDSGQAGMPSTKTTQE